jgi:hypothetical protein
MRRGMGFGRGCGYYNIAPMDSHIHSLSAKGVKTYVMHLPELVDEHGRILRQGGKYYYKKGSSKPVKFEPDPPLNYDYLTSKKRRYHLYAKKKDMYKSYCPNCGKKTGTHISPDVYCESCIKKDLRSLTSLHALGKVWDKVVKDILPHETRVRNKIANTLRDDEINTVIATMEYWGASDSVLRQAYSDMKFPRYRMGDWIGMFIQNEGYDKGGGETATRVLAHAYIKADGNIDKMIQDLRETDYEVDRSWEKIDLRVK